MKDFKETNNKTKSFVIMLIKRLYVIAFNIYAWYWLYREIFIRESTNYEEYLLWFLTTAGMYFFVLENSDLKISFKNKK